MWAYRLLPGFRCPNINRWSITYLGARVYKFRSIRLLIDSRGAVLVGFWDTPGRVEQSARTLCGKPQVQWNPIYK